MISTPTGMNEVVIASTQDALAVIESLQRMLKIQLGEEEEHGIQ